MGIHWKRIKTLGKGTYGTVSLASSSSDSNDDMEDQVLNDLPESFAVKSCEFECLRSLQKERELLYNFHGCPHVIQCYGADVSLGDDGIICYDLMLEYACYGSLADCIYSTRHGLRADEVRQHTRSVLSGLSYIHSKSFVHCDIKPDNSLLVDDHGEEGRPAAKISDFGLSKKAGERQKGRKRKKGFRGTPLYMAPESILYGEYECKADIWALGCTVMEMLTKKPAWDFGERVEVGELLDRIGNEEVEIPRGLSKDAEDFLNKCLIKNPELRWTADMLLGHPFVSGLDKASVTREIPRESSISTRSEVPNVGSSRFDSSSDDIALMIKPMLLINGTGAAETGDSVSGRGVTLTPKVTDNSVLDKSYEFPLCKRRKRLFHEDLQEAIKCNDNFGLFWVC